MPELLAELTRLTAHHRAACPPYARMLDAAWDGGHGPFATLADVPWLPVGLFKTHELKSIPDEAVAKVLTSSGTTGQARSKVFLDAEGARRQTHALAAAMRDLLGPARRPMLVCDHEGTVRDRHTRSARSAGILGMSTFGRDHLYALDEELALRTDDVRAWLRKHDGEELLVFGFTFMAWQALADADVDLSRATLVHSGGWKGLQDRAVSPDAFRARLQAATGVREVRSFYGMVEQIGAVFVEGPCGLLHAPAVADLVVRDPWTLAEQPAGEAGLVEVLSMLPESYPGHALLTEDLATVHHRGDCPCGARGTAFALHGRVPRAEVRGCSDTTAATVPVAPLELAA